MVRRLVPEVLQKAIALYLPASVWGLLVERFREEVLFDCTPEELDVVAARAAAERVGVVPGKLLPLFPNSLAWTHSRDKREYAFNQPRFSDVISDARLTSWSQMLMV